MNRGQGCRRQRCRGQRCRRQEWARLATLLAMALTVGRLAASDGTDTSVLLGESVHVLDCDGALHVLQPEAGRPATVLVFITAECPISASYLPTLNELANTWRAKNVRLYGVWSDAGSTPADVIAFRKDYDIAFPVLMDRDRTLAQRYRPTHVPEAFVLDAKGTVAYHGRIDDRFAALGRSKPAAANHDLANAVAAVLDGRAVEVAFAPPVGCLYESFSPSQGDEVTFNRDIAPILFANCVVCHREGEVGPFPLVTYVDAAKRADMIAAVVEDRLMPPWKPAQVHGEFSGQRTLTPQQIEAISRWAEEGRAEGNADDLPPVPQFASGWRLGPPDLILEMPCDFEIPADGTDVFQNFVINVDLPEDKAIAAADFIPGNPRVVHHALFYFDGSGKARTLDAATPEPGYGTFGAPGFVPAGSAGGWSPGKTPRRLPEGLGRRMKQGWDLVLQIHYHPDGKPEVDRSKVALYFADKDATIAGDIWASSHIHDIQPGDNNYQLTASYTLPQGVRMLGVVPHMHLLGRTMAAKAILPDGREQELITIRDWDFNWQDDYRFAEPIDLPEGTRLQVNATYDNSESNPSNPSSPPQRVRWGEGTADEMLYCFFLVVAEEHGDLRTLLQDRMRREVVGQMTGRLLRGRHPRPPFITQQIQQTSGTDEPPLIDDELPE